jgi:hypothetical protein
VRGLSRALESPGDLGCTLVVVCLLEMFSVCLFSRTASLASGVIRVLCSLGRTGTFLGLLIALRDEETKSGRFQRIEGRFTAVFGPGIT